MSIVPWLDPERIEFPAPESALEEPPGLLAAGGDLSPARLLEAYRRGIFPWYAERSPILWWSPDPRAILRPAALHVPRSLRRRLNRGDYRVTADTAFAEVIAACAAKRPKQGGTWITPAMERAYLRLHELGFAHSVEVWMPTRAVAGNVTVRRRHGARTLAGGIYGVSLGGAFFGESMFTRVTDGSKIAFVHLAHQLEAWGFALLDAQLQSAHLERFGVIEIPRRRFLDALTAALTMPDRVGPWRLTWDWREAAQPSGR